MPTKQQEASGRIWLSLLEMPWEEGRHVVRAEMGRLGLSQGDLIYKLRRGGYSASRTSVQSWLTGRANPTHDAVREIVLVLAAVSAGDSPKASQSSQPRLPEVFGPDPLRSHDRDSEPRKPSRQAPERVKSRQAA